jgi:hypothetical protein
MNSPASSPTICRATATNTLFPVDSRSGTVAGGLADSWLREAGALFKPVDVQTLQAQWRAQAAFGGEFAVRLLDAWRQVAQASLRLARQDSEAFFNLSHELLDCADAGAAHTLFARQLHPAAERFRLWQEQLLDACAGVQSDAAVLAESYMPAARGSVTAAAGELVALRRRPH